MEYESAFLIRSPEKILSKLSILLKNKCLLTAYFGDDPIHTQTQPISPSANEGVAEKNNAARAEPSTIDNPSGGTALGSALDSDGDSFITTILEINIKNNLLIFYHSPKKNAVEELLNSSKITFKTEYLGIKVAFDAIKVAKIQHQGVSVFAIPIPASILWIEARDFHRVKSPVTKSSYCLLTLKDQEPINFKLYDISLAGFSIINASSEVSALMIPDAPFEHCKIILANTGEGTVSFEIRSKYIINPETLNRTEKIGCRFTRITPAFEDIIQRYMQNIERENRQKT